jgi:ribosome-binding protein aMBF1 (putative translation factor)
MPARRKTGFDKFFDGQLKDRDFAAGYEQARREIGAVDRIVRALDEARIGVGMSKAELARRISTTPEVVRRLLTEEHTNPTIATVVKLARVLGLRLELVPSRSAAARRAQAKRRQVPTLRGTRERNSAPRARTSA